MKKQMYYYKIVISPVGKLTLVATVRGLYAVLFQNGRNKNSLQKELLVQDDSCSVLIAAEKQLNEYFLGKRRNFDLPLDVQGSVFQLKAWKELKKIPYGKTITYGEQARRIGDIKKARAAGMANGRNPLSIVVPCHRVIGASGHLTGFGGGLKVKQYLLDLEKQHAA